MIAGGGDGPTEHILHPLDRAAPVNLTKTAQLHPRWEDIPKVKT